METVLWLLTAQGILGAWDTIYYHEWKARLPARTPATSPELMLHAWRDFLYAVLFVAIPWLAWHGLWVLPLVAVLIAEIALTLRDFVVEIAVRKALGDVYAGERVMHAVLGIMYGAMLACLAPILWDWWSRPNALLAAPAGPEPLRWLLLVMAVLSFVSGARDLYAALGLPHGGWPWTRGVASETA